MRISSALVFTVALVGLAACSTTQLGGGSSLVTGSAGAEGNAKGEASQLARCASPIGTIALVESQVPALAQLGLTSPVPLLRLMTAQSSCFNVVERGQALTRMTEERTLAQGGLLQQGANVGGGQMVAADYYVTPNVAFSEGNAGGYGAAIGSVGAIIGTFVPGTYVASSLASTAGSLAGNLSFKEAQAILTVIDTRSGVQVGVAEGSAKATDLGGNLGLGSIRGFGGLSGYGNTNEGKVVAAAFLDAYNKLVEQIRTIRGK